MPIIQIKPLSVNEAWQGRRFKTNLYKMYENAVSLLLPSDYSIPKAKLELWVEWGFSSDASDIGNPEKLFTDILSKKYGFNDKKFYGMHLKKVIVEKGKEYIRFRIKKYDPDKNFFL